MLRQEVQVPAGADPASRTTRRRAGRHGIFHVVAAASPRPVPAECPRDLALLRRYAPRAAREADAAGRNRWLDGRADKNAPTHVARVSNQELYSFWINQDLVVPTGEFGAALGGCGF